MESIDLELGELFDRDAVDEDAGDDVGGNVDEANPEEQEGDEVLSNLKKLSKGAAKKKVTRPQPKLDAQRLKSDRGLPCLPQLFKDDQFSGKGHEPEDLKLLMSKLEHWAHRLFPKMSFDDFIERLEKLGAKKEIQTCVKRIRMDMPMLDSDFISTDVGADKPDDEENMLDAEAAYDAMIESELANQRNRTSLADDNASESDRTDFSNFTQHDIESPVTPAVSTTQSKTPLSSDVQRRIEQNRLLALQKRAARLGLQNSQTSSDNVTVATAEPSSSRRSMEAETQQQDDSVLDSSLPQSSSDINSADGNCSKDMRTADELLNDMDSESE